MADPNAESDTDQATGLMNRIVGSRAGAVFAVLVVLALLIWFLI